MDRWRGTTGMAEVVPFVVVDTVAMAAAFLLAAVVARTDLA